MTEAGRGRLRILALNWRCHRHPQAGGCEINLYEQAVRWVRAGHQVTIVTADPGRRYAPQRDEYHEGIAIRRRGGRLTVYLHAALYLLRRRGRFDRVLDVTNGVPFFAPMFTRRPVVLLVHHVHAGQWYLEFPRPIAAVGDFLERRVVPRLYRGRVIAVSETTRDALVDCGFHADAISVVHNGVQPPRAPDDIVREPYRLAYVGRLRAYKRLERLVEAAAALREHFPRLHVDIAGDGDARPALERLVRSLDLDSTVAVHGYVDDEAKASILARASVFVSPSMHEGWGVSVIEANSYGCPAVAFDVPGLSEAIRPGETGLLADDDLAPAVRALLTDAALWNRCSSGAREWASRFSWDRCAADGLEVLADPRRTTVAGT